MQLLNNISRKNDGIHMIFIEKAIIIVRKAITSVEKEIVKTICVEKM